MSQTRPWLTLGLAAALAVLLLNTYTSMRSERAADSGASARLVYDTLVTARQYHAIQGNHRVSRSRSAPRGARIPDSRSEAGRLSFDMRRLATAAKSPGSWRRFAVVEAMVGDEGWRRTVTRIPGASLDEPAFWSAVLGNERVDPARAPTYLARLARMDLGWYRHIAAQSLLSNAGRYADSERESAAADRSFYLLTSFGVLGVLMSLVAVLCVAVFGIVLLVQRKDPTIVLPNALRLSPPYPPLTQEQASVLYAAFVVYLMAFIAIRYVRMALSALFPSMAHLASGASAALSLPFLIAVVAAPLVVIRLLGRRVGLHASDLGFRRGRALSDMACGAVGWLATLPLLVMTMLFSTRIFRGYESPDNPAITEYTGVHSLLLQVLLFTVAAVYAPLAEETMFRGVFMRSLAPRLGVAGGIVVSSAIFALLHPQLPVGFAGIFVLGILFSVLYQSRGSLVPSITAHALNNGAIFVMLTLLLAN